VMHIEEMSQVLYANKLSVHSCPPFDVTFLTSAPF
jgi:hypothetical protein